MKGKWNSFGKVKYTYRNVSINGGSVTVNIIAAVVVGLAAGGSGGYYGSPADKISDDIEILYDDDYQAPPDLEAKFKKSEMIKLSKLFIRFKNGTRNELNRNSKIIASWGKKQ